MDEMLLTWRSGAPNSRELFGVVPQMAIEQQIWGGESTQTGVCHQLAVPPGVAGLIANLKQQSPRGGQPSVSTPQVLSELEFVLGQKQRTAQANPADAQSATHVNILLQVSDITLQSAMNSNVARSFVHSSRKDARKRN